MTPTPADPSPERRLDAILRALPEGELAGLIARMGIRVDKRKRIDVPAQVARALVRQPDVRDPNNLPPMSAELLRRIAELNGLLVVGSLPAGVEELVRRGIVYARLGDDGLELILPTALLVQMLSWEGEDPRSLRALLSETPFETASAIATHYLGRPSTPPIALSLEPAWEVLGQPSALRAEMQAISHQERRLLEQLEAVGGEVDTQELMDLEREPMRVRGVYGVAAGRRGAAFSLEKRGLLFPLHPNRYVLPTEVAAVIGAERRKLREMRRAEIRKHVMEEDYLPRRARFTTDPAPLALAMRLAIHDRIGEIRPAVGTAKSLISKLSQRFGQTAEGTSLLAALSRAVGLWEVQISVATPPGSLRLSELGPLLFDTWRRGGAWDEGREDPETMRLAPEQRDPSPVGVLREMVLDALVDLGEGQWVPYNALTAYIRDDPRAGGMIRLFERWAERTGVEVVNTDAVIQRLLVESLPLLGVVDLGGADATAASGSGEMTSLALRLTTRGCQLLVEDRQQRVLNETKSEMVSGRVLRVGGDVPLARVLRLASFVDLTRYDAELELEVSAGGIARGLASAIDAAKMRRLIARIAPLSDDLDEALKVAGTVVGRANLAAVSGFVWIDDPSVRELLRSTSPAAELFVDPSPPAGLLVAPGVDADRLTRHCRALGVEISVDEEAPRGRRTSVKPPKRTTNRRKKTLAWVPPTTRRRKRSSSGNNSVGE